jgi:hypothetical protein
MHRKETRNPEETGGPGKRKQPLYKCSISMAAFKWLQLPNTSPRMQISNPIQREDKEPSQRNQRPRWEPGECHLHISL